MWQQGGRFTERVLWGTKQGKCERENASLHERSYGVEPTERQTEERATTLPPLRAGKDQGVRKTPCE